MITANINDEGVVEFSDSGREVVAKALGVIDQAGNIQRQLQREDDKKDENGDKGDDKKTTDTFKGLPMLEVIGTPLYSVVESQQKLVPITLDFYKRIAFYQRDENMPDNKKVTGGETRFLRFKVKRAIKQDGEVKMLEQTIEAPFLT